MFAAALLGLLALMAQPAVAQDSPVLVGTVTRVVDGDTIDVDLPSDPVRVRLHAIDAPELKPLQSWGGEATDALRDLVLGQQVALEVVEQRSYKRMVATVYLGDENVNAWLVWNGLAWTERRYARDPTLCEWEGAARSNGRGLWSAPTKAIFAPWEWRQKSRRDSGRFTDYSGETVENCVASLGRRGGSSGRTEPTVAAPVERESGKGDCRIKGNISRSGQIYHIPGSAAYEHTRIDESKGERWFCSEAEARAAGWRSPK